MKIVTIHTSDLHFYSGIKKIRIFFVCEIFGDLNFDTLS